MTVKMNTEIMTRKKRVFFETEEVIRKTRRGYIDLEMEYFQFYNVAFHYLASLTNNCAKDFVLWIMGRVSDDNEFNYSRSLYHQFIDDLSKIARPKSYTENTVHVALRELVDDGILIRMGRGRYKVNPKLFWSEGTSKRIQTIRELESNTRALEGPTQGTPILDSEILPAEEVVEETTETTEQQEVKVEEKVEGIPVPIDLDDDPLAY
jgi:hypothetical protein